MPRTATPTRRAARPRLLASAGSNAKLGALIHSFSIPAIETCPGATDFCRGLCYALKNNFRSPNILRLYKSNMAVSRRRDFAFRLAKEIRGGLVRTVRIHVSGDFYSAAYVRKWIAIVRACPSRRFFTYTRSWRDPKILPALLKLAEQPNVSLFWSEDRETGESPAVPGVRVCFLVRDESDEALVDPRRHALVFRDHHHRRAASRPGQVKRINSVLVCPHEQNPVRRSEAQKAAMKPPVPCSVCRICTKREPSRSHPRLAILP